MAEKTSVSEPNSEINKLVYVTRDDGSYGGWKTELLVEKISSKIEEKFLLCNYCRGMLRDACFYEKDGKHKVACSLCIPKDVNKQIAQLNSETVNEKQVYCPLKKEGCDWTNELSELLHHLEECKLFLVACPLKCEYCSVSVKACDMNGHLEVCEEFPIPCPNKCSEENRVKRKDKSIHLSQECPLQETECPYSQYGCEVKVQRRNLEQHEKEDIHKHLKFTMNKVVKLEKDNKMVRDLVSTGILVRKISGVKSKILQKEETYTDPFYVGLYKFQGCVHWNKEHNYVGLYLHIMKGEWDEALKWPIKYKFRQAIVSQLDASNSYICNVEIPEKILEEVPGCFIKPNTERNGGIGSDKFISHGDLLQEKYSKDDEIVFIIRVELL